MEEGEEEDEDEEEETGVARRCKGRMRCVSVFIHPPCRRLLCPYLSFALTGKLEKGQHRDNKKTTHSVSQSLWSIIASVHSNCTPYSLGLIAIQTKGRKSKNDKQQQEAMPLL